MSLSIELKNGYWLLSDQHNYILATQAQNGVFQSQSFSGNIETILDRYAEKRVREADVTTFKELREEVSQIRQELTTIRQSLDTRGYKPESEG